MSLISVRGVARQLPVRPAHRLIFAQSRLAHSPKSSNTSKSDPGTLSQGHATFDKSNSKEHGDKDIQTSYVNSGQRQRQDSATPGEQKGDASAGAEPFDAARQGNKGGEVKRAPAESEHGDPGQRGAMKEQIGGHGLDQPGKSGEVGGESEAAGAGDVMKSAKDMAKQGFEGLKSLREQKKNFSTLSRLLYPSSPADGAPRDGTGSREPHVDPSSLPEGSAQSPHLKHKAPGSSDSGSGNAGAEPRLPSHTTDTQPKGPTTQDRAGGVGAKREMSTSARLAAKEGGGSSRKTGDKYTGALDTEGRKAGYNVPPEALPSTLKSDYDPTETLAASADKLTPTREAGFSSSATDPPHPVLREKALDGTLPNRNPQPQPEAGKVGLKDAWKGRKQ